VNAVKISEDEV